MRIPFLILSLLLGATAASAQTAEIDSLKRVIETAKLDTVRAKTYSALAEQLIGVSQFDAALNAAQAGAELSRRIRFSHGEAMNLSQQGYALYMTGKSSEAIMKWRTALPLFKSAGNLKGVSDCYANIGSMHSVLGKPDSCIDYYERSYELDMKRGAEADAAITLVNIASYYTELARFSDALKAYHSALRTFTKLKDDSKIAFIHASIGTLYSRMYEEMLALKHTRIAATTLERCRCDDRLLAGVYGNLGGMESDTSLKTSYLAKSLRMAERLSDWVKMANSAAKLVEISIDLGRRDSARRYLQLSEAIVDKVDELHPRHAVYIAFCKYYLDVRQPESLRKNARAALEVAKQIQDVETYQITYNYLYIADTMFRDYESAFRNYVLYQKYESKLRNQENAREVGRLEAKFEADKALEVQKTQQTAERERFGWMLGSAGGGLALLLIVAFTLFQGRRKEKRANTQLRALNDEISQQKAEIESMNAELQATLDTIKHQHEQIEDSIHYASRIQHAILPSAEQLLAALPTHFIHYQPRDIVSGDFYWLARFEGKVFFAAVDCTGHGVPGAFMSVVGHNLLNQVVNETGITRPAAILKALDRRITQVLRQQFGGDSKDGMDVALVVLHEADDAGNCVVEFAGAGRPLWALRGGEFSEYKSAKYACGGSQHEAKEFPAHRIEIKRGDRLYLFSDGVTDQFGGPQGRKLGSAKLQAHLLETSALPVEAQGKAFADFFAQWMGKRKQLDDVLLAGVEV